MASIMIWVDVRSVGLLLTGSIWVHRQGWRSGESVSSHSRCCQSMCTFADGVKYNIQPRGPIMGVITQRLCTWRSNFGSTAIALIANFLASLRESEEDEDEDDEDKKENADGREKFMTEMAASLLEGYAFLFADPDTCKASEIYRSVFMLQMIATTHLNTVTGFIDVPELDTQALSSTRMECVIGACAVALERALKLVAQKEKKSTDLKTPLKINKTTGKETSTPLAFSELNWGQFTTDYHLSIVKRGPKYTTDTIAMARQFVKDLGSDASMKGSLADDSVASCKEYLFYNVFSLPFAFSKPPLLIY
ncbi:hypothetical protein CY34DRAFT_13858 [Suillus luteus UH-Slu-Lm8-n1]|uniref:Unplaced genomic scaffold CY34scaffold_180, whole genome shotgun sequence n=1 Tax=Suillus luteus UH-Slu-Lm8-n1 TaxID=930992 RepID=A0A0D0AES0_9AGAM|nr:hypothetical protein CY34DRAFT_13858 [Suillus luteus UH-Slu-Lm8-n1]